MVQEEAKQRRKEGRIVRSTAAEFSKRQKKHTYRTSHIVIHKLQTHLITALFLECHQFACFKGHSAIRP